MKPLLPITAVAMLLAGCGTFLSLPPEARRIHRIGVSSERVYVWKPTLKFQEGVFVLQGDVQKRFHNESTLGTHLQVAFYDADGSKLRDEWLDFTPAELPITWGRRPRTGSYVEKLGTLPAGTAQIEVRAVDAAHGGSGRR